MARILLALRLRHILPCREKTLGVKDAPSAEFMGRNFHVLLTHVRHEYVGDKEVSEAFKGEFPLLNVRRPNLRHQEPTPNASLACSGEQGALRPA